GSEFGSVCSRFSLKGETLIEVQAVFSQNAVGNSIAWSNHRYKFLSPFEAVMNLAQSAVPPQFGNLRKREFLEYVEASANEQDRRGKFNAAYREDDRKFMRFLIPPGKRVLELGCGRGELLAALEPSYGVGVDFGARTIAKARELHRDLQFVLGDVEDPATLATIEGPFDYIVIADTIGM